MKTATVTQLQREFSRVEKWLAKGQTVAITKRGKVVAELRLPYATPVVPHRIPTKADFAKRFALPKNWKPSKGKSMRDLLMEERDSYKY
jgi:antitoxin (DNA-binding transcriptional repressor) of toxin-antitoxin stability system